MADSPSPTSKQEDMMRMVQKLYDHGKQTGEWLHWNTVKAAVHELEKYIILKSQNSKQTDKNMTAIMENFKAQVRIRDAQQPTPAKKARKAIPTWKEGRA